MSRRRILRVVVSLAVTTVVAVTLSAGVAYGHGLLQVDVLTHQDVFVPPWAVGGEYALDPRLSSELSRRLAALRAAGAPTKVVLVAQRVDLEDADMYFDHPVVYAAFLDQLLVGLRIFDGRLVIVMPHGTAQIVGGGQAQRLPFQPRMRNIWDVDALARTALAALRSRPRAAVVARPSGPAHGTPWRAIGLGAAAAILLVGLGGGLWSRRRLAGREGAASTAEPR